MALWRRFRPKTRTATRPGAAVLALAVGALATLGGCDAIKQVAKSAPAAAPPQLLEVGSPPMSQRLRCWSSADCYFPTSALPARGSNRDYQIAFAVRYRVLNTLAVQQDGIPAVKTDSAEPPSDETSVYMGDFAQVAGGSGTSDVFVFPKRTPSSPAHGQTSTFTFVETSSNPDIRNTPAGRASSEFHVTFVDSGRCRVTSFGVPGSAAANTDASLSWDLGSCKTFQIYQSASPGAASGGSSSVAPGRGGGFSRTSCFGPGQKIHDEPVAAGVGAAFQGSKAVRTWSGTQGATETYTLVAIDALGRCDAEQKTLTVPATQSSSGGGGGNPPPQATGACPGGAAKTIFPLCVVVPGLYGGPDTKLDTTESACNEADAKTQAQTHNCAVTGCRVDSGACNWGGAPGQSSAPPASSSP